MADTRERIVEVASDLFLEQGYDATSLRAIAERLGITKAALYYHFAGKDDILRAVVEPVGELQRELITKLDDADDLEGWADALAWVADQMFQHARLFEVVERNRSAIAALSTISDFFDEHQRLHEQVQEAVMKSGHSLQQQVRMICALGAVTAFDDWARPLIDLAPGDDLRRELQVVMRGILGLPDHQPSGA